MGTIWSSEIAVVEIKKFLGINSQNDALRSYGKSLDMKGTEINCRRQLRRILAVDRLHPCKKKNQRREMSGENATETLEGIVKIINKVTEKQKSARRTTERPSLNLRRVKCETRRKKL